MNVLNRVGLFPTTVTVKPNEGDGGEETRRIKIGGAVFLANIWICLFLIYIHDRSTDYLGLIITKIEWLNKTNW